MLFCILLMGLIYFMGTFTGRGSQRDLSLESTSTTDNEKKSNWIKLKRKRNKVVCKYIFNMNLICIIM